MTHPSADDLAGVPLFTSLDPGLLEKFAHRFDVEVWPAGHKLTREGAAGYAFYVLHDGAATVTQNGEAIASIGPGDFFGELSILGDGHRTATVTTDVETTVWTLFGTSFRELELEAPEVTEVIRSAVADRIFQPE